MIDNIILHDIFITMSTQANRVISKFQTQQRLADAIGVGQSVIAAWKKRGFVPARQQPRVLEAAQKLGIDLKPDDFFGQSAE